MSLFSAKSVPPNVSFLLPNIHPVVDDRIDHGVGHGEPVKGQVDMLDEGLVDDTLVVKHVEEVHVVGEPAHAKDSHDDDEHFHDLEEKNRLVRKSNLLIKFGVQSIHHH